MLGYRGMEWIEEAPDEFHCGGWKIDLINPECWRLSRGETLFGGHKSITKAMDMAHDSWDAFEGND